MIRELTITDFDNTVSSNHTVLVEFFSHTCQPCKMLLPALQQIAEDNRGDVLVCKVDAKNPANSSLASRYDVDRVPVTVLIHKGQVAHYTVGVWHPETIQNAIDNVLG